MLTYTETGTVISSVGLRILVYVFLRWIPGHQLPPLIYLSLLSYLGFFARAWRTAGEANQWQARKEQVTATPSSDASLKGSANGGKTRKGDADLVDDDGHKISRGREPKIARSLVYGLPSSSLWSSVTVSLHVILALFVVDMVYRAQLFNKSSDLSFARVGYVSDTTASILVREPNPSQLPIYVSYRSVPDNKAAPVDAWKSVGQLYWLSNETDFTSSLTISKLSPTSRYQYSVSNNHTGFFVTAPRAGGIPEATGKFTFLASSCIKANFPYSPFSHALSVPGFQHLAKWIPSLHASFMLFLGDFIYIDVPRRFGSDVESYRQQYRQVYASGDFPAVSTSLPWIHVIDDHDIANDWDQGLADPYQAAIEPWNLYHKSVNPPSAGNSTSYATFTQGPASFFLLDTRRYRSPTHPLAPAAPEKTMLGSTQLSSLLAFLRHRDPPGVKWKFVISSVPFTRNWRINAADTWAGFLYERNLILEAMWDVSARGVGVIIISGDRHEFGATAFPPPKDGKWPLSATVHEFSCSPLNQFYLPTRSYWEAKSDDDVEEVCIKYIPDGNSKFGAVELEGVGKGEQGLLRYRLFVDGVESWQHVLTTPLVGEGERKWSEAVWGE